MVNIKVWIVLVNNFNVIRGKGISKGISSISIVIINLFVRMLLNKWKFRERGFVKFFKILMGKRMGMGCM